LESGLSSINCANIAREREEADFGALMSSEDPTMASRGPPSSSVSSRGGRQRSVDEKTWLAKQNRKLSEAQDLRESREEDHERMKMERDARTREEEEERHQKHEQDDFVRHIMMARLQSGASLLMRKKVEETWRTQLDGEFAGRRRLVTLITPFCSSFPWIN
jgi:arylamine N-acetyltransferase